MVARTDGRHALGEADASRNRDLAVWCRHTGSRIPWEDGSDGDYDGIAAVVASSHARRWGRITVPAPGCGNGILNAPQLA